MFSRFFEARCRTSLPTFSCLAYFIYGGILLRQTKERESKQMLTVDIEGLAAMLSCGQATARKIAEDAGARITIGRRVLYSVSKIEKYLEAIAE